ncbi:MAG: peptidoglycan-binding domain-containing protein [Planctomycetota bacterium]|jgi:hypothetical protein
MHRLTPCARPGLFALLLALAASLPALAQTPSDYHLLDGARQGHYVKIGERGGRVMALQRALNQAGAALTEDGIFLGLTWGAIKRFQTQSGLVADGVVGPKTMLALDAALNAGGSTPTPPPGPQPPPTAPPTGTPGGVIPARPYGAMSGQAFLASTDGLSRPAREDAILREFLAGNLPDHQRTFRSLRFRAPDASGRYRDVEIAVSVDYLAIGSDSDFVRMPMGGRTAQRIADAFGCSLPTRAIVDRIHASADVKLTPIPLTPSALMMSNDYFRMHHARLAAQTAGLPLGALLAGHKKDVVISNRLLQRPDRVAIYGWHWPGGQPIQPLSTVHYHSYADYSHGVRLIDRRVTIDGAAYDIEAVLKDATFSRLLSDEGAMPSPRIPGV